MEYEVVRYLSFDLPDGEYFEDVLHRIKEVCKKYEKDKKAEKLEVEVGGNGNRRVHFKLCLQNEELSNKNTDAICSHIIAKAVEGSQIVKDLHSRVINYRGRKIQETTLESFSHETDVLSMTPELISYMLFELMKLDESDRKGINDAQLQRMTRNIMNTYKRSILDKNP